MLASMEVDDNTNQARCKAAQLATMPAMYQATVHTFTQETSGPTFSNTEPPPGAIILDDPYKVYLHSAPEWILDPGSQIISMSKEACHVLGLIHNPRLRLHMWSTNGKVVETLGLARNVPMLLGEITFYVQFHVIRNPAYDIHLGRPFDVLLESIVCNYKNKDQTITMIPTLGELPPFPPLHMVLICKPATKLQIFVT